MSRAIFSLVMIAATWWLTISITAPLWATILAAVCTGVLCFLLEHKDLSE